MKINQRPSPNFNDRKDGASPDFLIIHYTGMQSAQAALDRLCDKDAQVSAHYLIDEDGTIYQMVAEEKRAWHAGKSHWDGVEDINSRSIGIELVNPGHEFGYRAFSEAQMQALLALCGEIRSRHNIPDAHVLAHSDIAPDRKDDPGELFDWSRMAREGFGLWPQPLKEDFEQAAGLVYNAKRLREAFAAYGYNPKTELKVLIMAFQRHFQPEVFKTPEKVGQANVEMAARLQALLRQKKGPVF